MLMTDLFCYTIDDLVAGEKFSTNRYRNAACLGIRSNGILPHKSSTNINSYKTSKL